LTNFISGYILVNTWNDG